MQREIRVWELYFKDGLVVNFVANLSGHNSTTNVVRFSPDGQMIASGDIDGCVLIWRENPMDEEESRKETLLDDDSSDIPPNKENWVRALRTPFRHDRDVTNLCWSPDSLMVASVSMDDSILCHRVDTGKRVWSVRGFRHFPNGIVWDPRGKYVVTLSTDRRLDILDALKGTRLRCCHSVELPTMQLSEDVNLPRERYKVFHDDQLISFTRAVEFSPCGSVVFAPAAHLEVGANNVYGTFVYKRADFEKCRPSAMLQSEKPTIAVKCSPVYYELRDDVKGNFLGLPYRLVYAVMTKDSVMVYDSQYSEPFYYIDNMHFNVLTSVSWSPDGKVLAISSMEGYISFVTVEHRVIGKVCKKPPIKEEETMEILPIKKKKDQEKEGGDTPLVVRRKGHKEEAESSASKLAKTPIQQATENELKENKPKTPQSCQKKLSEFFNC
ncbi:chromatin assembly factor 1 subunit B [Ditylenchus destructor]|nr:chromatin assembly factor 1 subunit B [Ditylenchus destructor]